MEAGVAIGAIGESYTHLIPNCALPQRLRSAATKALVGKWSTVILVGSLVLAVPIGIIKDIISDRIIGELGGEIHRVGGPRNLDRKQIDQIVAALKPFGGKPYDLTLPLRMEPGSVLDNQIIGLLKQAGWEFRPMKGDVPKAPAPNPVFFSDMSSIRTTTEIQELAKRGETLVGVGRDVIGVRILYDAAKAPDLVRAAFTLSNELKAVGINGEVGHAPTEHGMADDVIHIMIGSK